MDPQDRDDLMQAVAESAAAGWDELTWLRAELAGPLGLNAAELERLAPLSAPGTCTGCHTPLIPPRNGTCWLCAELSALQATRALRVPSRSSSRDDAPARRCRYGVRNCGSRHDRAHRVADRIVLTGIGIALFIAAAHLWAPLVLPAIACIGMAGSRRLS